MKIAIPTRDGHVDNHFGHCDHYTIFEVENDKILNESRLDSPEGCGCKSNIAGIMHDMGITIMLAGNMGQGAVNKLSAAGISVVRGCSGDVKALVADYLAGKVHDNSQVCDHHDCNSHSEPQGFRLISE